MKHIVAEDRNGLAKLFTGIGVEVGVAAGEYSKIILDNGVEKLYGIDPYKRLPDYYDYMKESTFRKLYEDTKKRLRDYPNFFLILETSEEALKRFDDNSLDFVYIDGNHNYENVLFDVTEWTKKVKPGGIVAGDDYVKRKGQDKYYDVIRAVDEYVGDRDLYIYAEGRSNWMFRK